MSNITGRLENWAYNAKSNTLVGEIYDDVNGRFPDGSQIQTSRLKPMSMQVTSPKEGAVMATLNSSYLLGKRK